MFKLCCEIGGHYKFYPGNLTAYCLLKMLLTQTLTFPTTYLKACPSFDQNPNGELALGTICLLYPGVASARSKPSAASPTSKRSPRLPGRQAYFINTRSEEQLYFRQQSKDDPGTN